jgi:cell division septation protein DedD
MFMAVTVVAVVIFLCGVMVGRGVRTPRATEASDIATGAPTDPTAAVQAPAVSTDANASTTTSTTASGTPVTTQEKLTYADRLASSTSPPETLRSEPIAPTTAQAEPPSAAKVPVAEVKTASKSAAKPESKTQPKAESKAEAKAESKTAAAESEGGGFVVQVAAVKARSEADTIAKRLSSKGFPSYVTTPGPGAANVYRVRVGKFTDRREAESVARRLEKEEQFKPWITR